MDSPSHPPLPSPSYSSLIAAIRADEAARAHLAWPCDFDLDRGDAPEEVHLASGTALEPLAGDGAGNTYYFCGEGGEERPVLYADLDGRATLLAIGLPELLRLLLVVPWWRDCTEFTAEQSREIAAEYLADLPDLPSRSDRAAQALSLDLPDEAAVLARLREVALERGRDFVLVYTPENEPYEPLFDHG